MSPRPYQNMFSTRSHGPPRLCLAGSRAAAVLTEWDLIFSRQQARSPPPSPKPAAPLSPQSPPTNDSLWSSAASTFTPELIPHDIAFIGYHQAHVRDQEIGQTVLQHQQMEHDGDICMPLTPQSSIHSDDGNARASEEEDGERTATDAQSWINEMDVTIEDSWASLAAEIEQKEASKSDQHQQQQQQQHPVDSVIQSLSAITIRPISRRITLPPPPQPAPSMPLPCRAKSFHSHYDHHHHLHAEGVIRPRTPLFGKPSSSPSPPSGNGGIIKAYKYGRLSCAPPKVTKVLRGSGRQSNIKIASTSSARLR